MTQTLATAHGFAPVDPDWMAQQPVPAFEAAPLMSPSMQVRPDWIDYNGHMNVAYYTMAFDQGLDFILEQHLGIGESYAKKLRMGPMALQQQVFFLGEMMEGESFKVAFRLLDHDAKRIHFFIEMIRDSDGQLCATMEALSMNVDLEARRSAAYPDWALARINALAAAQTELERPIQAGKVIAIRKR